MLLLVLIQIVNAVISFKTMTTLRVNLSAFPVNLMDALVFLGLILSILPRGSNYFKTEKTHILLPLTILVFILASIGAGIGSAGNGASARQTVTCARNLLSFPMVIYLGYRFFTRPEVTILYCYLVAILGFIVAGIICYNFGDRASDLSQVGGTIENVRIVEFHANYCGVACGLLLFAMGSGVRPIFSPLIAVSMAACCFVGNIAPLSRSSWLGLFSGLSVAVLLMKRWPIGTKMLYSSMMMMVLALFLSVGIFISSSISGKNVGEKLTNRFLTMLPGEYEGSNRAKAWATRTNGTIKELELWLQSPLIGRGFGIQDTMPDVYQDSGSGYRHNTWVSTLAESGLLGFTGMVMCILGMGVIGWRMVKADTDRYSTLIGGLAVIIAANYTVEGYCTMLFNIVRGTIVPAMTFGIVLRMRTIQLQQIADSSYENAFEPVMYNYVAEDEEMAVAGGFGNENIYESENLQPVYYDD